ncbi:hypothetical protein WMO13_06635 [Ignatzschineria larvae DSM 13226]|uniref:CRISPR type III-B/RAMP module-associated protein Cmr5 n=1 Tax=Ignatzschineria larvae DSM 13226 TaxID=1111732 RepID=A0ABZ3BXE4_9GAMM|nr:hypothetical protein [Ignatzschineria larvae]
MSRRDYNYANYCLEQWVIWNTEHNGFPHRSPLCKLGEMAAHIAESSIPSGVEPFNRDVERANLVLAMMNDSCNKGAERSHLLKVITKNRSDNESIDDVIKKVGIKNKRDYYEALDEFTVRLETIIYNKKQG